MILSCQSISKSFGTDEILKDVSFHIEANEKQRLSASMVPASLRCLKLLWVKKRPMPVK